ncbi:glycerol-3-phosphate dehydrogenase/oxidase [Rubrobacter taiwanensis]|jgi:glycerol-3-phosphate dehydrogenase|uniref:Glycerol-3-phosphate dehydrogenase/oxidase n=1 Tax=Rubrobacter taiwanensis TaxID=185139 RepID=A0A4V2NWR7_9ACTN|nr:glycerol-3-phosphate dehydrogenase/oxidase [Rubrobacter taiwanensis]TCJ18452.1 glycerol-3-phosphate dehydrogenase/oxidase [Rubrobacter taiwanensis]
MSRQIPQGIEGYGFDLIVVGAGINGAGIARDAAMRGLKTLLLDKGDVSSGTTMWSTRLIHGGLRYLEYFEVSLVRESLKEREILLRVAPHLVHPLPFFIPVYEGDRWGPSIAFEYGPASLLQRHNLLLVRLGMIAYDILSYDKSLESHRMFGREEALAYMPGVNPEGLRGAARYFDAQVEFPERLTVENAVSAREHGAVVIPYARVDGFLREGDRIRGVEFVDVLSGGRHTARAPVVVNVAGPWVDEVLLGLDRPSPRLIGGTKGSHIVVEAFPGAPREAIYVRATDGRPYFIVPWNGRYLIGTTDIHYEGDLDHVVAGDEEIDYLIGETNRVIPAAGLARGDVLYAYAGVRPLPYEPGKSAGQITRSHIIRDYAPELEGLISIVGGKITTYRNLARETVDMVLKKLGRPDPGCRTQDVPLPGGGEDFEGFAADFKAGSGLGESLASRLLRIYGVRAPEVLALSEGEPDLRMPLAPDSDVIGAEVLFAFLSELASSLTDFMMRRSMAGYDSHVGLGVDRAAAEIAGRYLDWDGERIEREVREYREYVRRFRPRTEIPAA